MAFSAVGFPNATGITPNATMHPAENDLILISCIPLSGGDIEVPDGYTLLYNLNGLHTVFYRMADGTETSITVDYTTPATDYLTINGVVLRPDVSGPFVLEETKVGSGSGGKGGSGSDPVSCQPGSELALPSEYVTVCGYIVPSANPTDGAIDPDDANMGSSGLTPSNLHNPNRLESYINYSNGSVSDSGFVYTPGMGITADVYVVAARWAPVAKDISEGAEPARYRLSVKELPYDLHDIAKGMGRR